MIQFFQHLRRTNVQLQAATAAAPAGTATGADGDMAQPQGPSSPAPAQLPAAEDRAAHPVPQADKQHVPAVPGPAEQALHQQSTLAGVLQEYREAVPLPDCRTHGFRGTHLLPAGPPGQVRRQADGPYTSHPGQHLVQQPESGLPPHRLRSVLRQVRASPPEYPEVQPAQNTLTTAREERHARCLRRFG